MLISVKEPFGPQSSPKVSPKVATILTIFQSDLTCWFLSDTPTPKEYAQAIIIPIQLTAVRPDMQPAPHHVDQGI